MIGIFVRHGVIVVFIRIVVAGAAAIVAVVFVVIVMLGLETIDVPIVEEPLTSAFVTWVGVYVLMIICLADAPGGRSTVCSAPWKSGGKEKQKTWSALSRSINGNK